jgi:hypothetical protein
VFDQRLHLLLVRGRHLEVLGAGGGEDGLERGEGDTRETRGERKEGEGEREQGEKEGVEVRVKGTVEE